MLDFQVIGYVGKDASVKEVNGKKAVNFSVAHTEKYKDGTGTTVEKTVWVDCTKWDGENVAPFLKQGTLVCVKGTPEAHGYLNKENKPSATLKLRVMQLQLLAAKKEGAANTAQPAPKQEEEVLQDDLPF